VIAFHWAIWGKNRVVYLRRAILIASLAAAAPAGLTALLYFASKLLLYETSRTIDPHILWYAGGAEFLAFFYVGILEVKGRW